jgi:hypothetical protein
LIAQPALHALYTHMSLLTLARTVGISIRHE